MKRAAWNLAALLVFVAAGLFGYVLTRTHLYQALGLSLLGMAALSWGFYPRRFAAWRTVVGWSYTGLSLGMLGGLGAAPRVFWQAAGTVVLAALVLLVLPGLFNSLFWTAALLRLRPAAWSGPEQQGRDAVLATAPFTLHEVVKVTEQLAGGVVQTSASKSDRMEWRYRGEPVETGSDLGELEDWLLGRYRQYRTLRRLPLSAELTAGVEVTREEDHLLTPYSSATWNQPWLLTPGEAVAGSPFVVSVKILTSSEAHEVRYTLTAGGTGTAGGQRQQPPILHRRFVAAFGPEWTDISEQEFAAEGQIVEQVSVKLASTRRTVGLYADLASAEAAIWAKYLNRPAAAPQTEGHT